VVETVARQGLGFTIRERHQAPMPEPWLIVASAVPKGERFRNMIDMLSQLGVAVIVPLSCERSAAKPKPSSGARWRRIAIEACKQSRNPYVPDISEPVSVDDSLTGVEESDSVLYAEPGGDKMGTGLSARGRLRLYIGPEGGFTERELILLMEHGARPVALGGNILRVETAAVAGAVLALLSSSGGRRN
jgi:16S rRNA (uracil1498-N3)-methyltransferase